MFRTVKILLLLTIFSSCASADKLFDRAIKKDPDIIRRRVPATVQYIKGIGGDVNYGDSIPIQINYPDIYFPEKRTRKEKKYSGKLFKEEWRQEKLRTKMYKDSLDLLRLEEKNLKKELKIKNQELKALRNQNRGANWEFIRNYWLVILLCIVAVVLMVLWGIRRIGK